jgi:hypothetical protein
MPMWRKNTWCLAIITGIFCVMLNCASAQNISVNYPSQVDYGKTFSVNVVLLNFSIDTYDIKIDILNSSSGRIAKIWSGSTWQSTTYYVNSIINTSAGNESALMLNITNIYNGTASMEIKVRDSGGDIETFSNYSLNVNYQNSSGNQSQQNSTNSTSNSTGNVSASIDLDYASEVKNGEFEITAKLYNLELKDYDIKVYVTFEENDTVISETYNENEWKSSTYYINNIVSGTGNKTLNVKLRIDDKYSKFKGNAKLNARLRESASSNTVANFEDNIKILEKENSSSQSSNQGTITLNLLSNSSNNSNGGIGLTSNVIKLNSPSSASTNTTKDIKSNIVYKSKVEYFKEYGFYALGIVCIVIIFVLLRK